VADEVKKESALAKACAKSGDVLVYDAPRKRDLPAWVAGQFEQLGANADRDACRLLVEMVGEDPDQLRSEIEKVATWSAGEPVTAVTRLADLDLALKGGSRLSGELEFERAVVEVTRAPS